MASETFRCPHCRCELRKSAQAFVIGEIVNDKQASFMATGGMPETVPCPRCRGPIDVARMMRGDYDGQGTLGGLIGAGVGLLVGAAAIMLLGWSWWLALIIGFAAFAITAAVIDGRRRG